LGEQHSWCSIWNNIILANLDLFSKAKYEISVALWWDRQEDVSHNRG
jgi:hypothetical protein